MKLMDFQKKVDDFLRTELFTQSKSLMGLGNQTKAVSWGSTSAGTMDAFQIPMFGRLANETQFYLLNGPM